MPSWELVKKVAEATLGVALSSDVTRQEMDSVVSLADSARRARLREIGDEVRRRLAAQWGKGGGDKDAVKLGQRSARCLQALASKGDDRARRLLPYVTVAWAAHGQLDDLGHEIISFTFAEHLETGRTMNARRGWLAGLSEQVEFLRDVGRACLMDVEHPAWPPKPSEGTEALFVVQEGQSVLLPSRGWHLVKLKKVRRTRASAQLIQRLDRDGDWGGRIGREFDYPLSSLVGSRSADVKAGGADSRRSGGVESVTFRLPARWGAEIRQGNMLPILGPQASGPPTIHGWVPEWRCSRRGRVQLILCAGSLDVHGWDEEESACSFSIQDIDQGKWKKVAFDDGAVHVRCVWKNSARKGKGRALTAAKP